METLRQWRTHLNSLHTALFRMGERAIISELNFAINANLAANNIKLG